MRVGAIVKLKRACLGNPIGTIGVVFYNYGTGSQVIFENGEYDGFDEEKRQTIFKFQTEKEFILAEIGFEKKLEFYKFINVMQVSRDHENGMFDLVLRRKGL